MLILFSSEVGNTDFGLIAQEKHHDVEKLLNASDTGLSGQNISPKSNENSSIMRWGLPLLPGVK